MRELAIAPGIALAGLLAFAHPALADIAEPPSTIFGTGDFAGIAGIAVVIAVAACILIFRRKR